jgi:hypothetical protein
LPFSFGFRPVFLPSRTYFRVCVSVAAFLTTETSLHTYRLPAGWGRLGLRTGDSITSPDPPKPCEFIAFGALDVAKPYKFTWFGDIHGPKPYEFIEFRWALISQTPVASRILNDYPRPTPTPTRGHAYWISDSWGAAAPQTPRDPLWPNRPTSATAPAVPSPTPAPVPTTAPTAAPNRLRLRHRHRQPPRSGPRRS